MGMLFTYIGLFLYDEDVLTPSLDDLMTITDAKANIVIEEDVTLFLDKYAYKESSGIRDLPIMDVCRLLYDNDPVTDEWNNAYY